MQKNFQHHKDEFLISVTKFIKIIELYSAISNKDWILKRTLLEFRNLNDSLLKGFFNVPTYPIVQIKDENSANVLRLALQNYLCEILVRGDLINSLHLKQFLELENHLTNYQLFQPLLINEIDTSMEVTDIYFSKRQDLLFAGLAYSSSSDKFSSYISSLSSLWNSTYLGGFCIYHIVKSNYGEFNTQKIYLQALHSQVSIINYIEGDNLDVLILGLFDGSLLYFKIYANFQIYVSKNLVDQVAKIKPHKNRVINFGIEESVGYCYSAAYNEKSIVISEMNYESIITSFNVSKNSLNNFVYDKENRRIFVTDILNSLWILKVDNYIEISIIQAIHNQYSELNCIRVETDRNFIFIGTKIGSVKFYDFEEKTSEINDESLHNFKIIVHHRLDIKLGISNIKVNDIKYQHGRSGLITSLSNGSVAFWSHDAEAPEFIHDCHSKSVNKILYDDSLQTLITCSSDQKIKFWQLPATWPSEIMRENKDFNDKNFIEEFTCNTNNLMKIQDAIKDLNFNDGEADYLNDSPTGENTTQFSQSNRNSIRKKNSVDTMQTSEELIDSDYIYQEVMDQDDTSLDGWENETSIGLNSKTNGFERLYNFIGV